MKTLITGATGYLGSEIVKQLLNSGTAKNNLLLLGNSEKRSDSLRRKYGVKVLIGDICDKNFLRNIFSSNKIDKIFHCAAIKYVSVSNDNPTRTVEVNVIGSYHLYNLAKKYDVRNVVSVSTDKALKPSNIYGMSKRLMEELSLAKGFTVVSGVNFFGSTGSVLDIWFEQFHSGSSLTITDPKCIRYFVKTEDMVKLILSSVGNKGLFHCNNVYKVEMGDLLGSFMRVFDYNDYKITGLLQGEKLVEDVPIETTVVESSTELLEEMIKTWRKARFDE